METYEECLEKAQYLIEHGFAKNTYLNITDLANRLYCYQVVHKDKEKESNDAVI